MPELPEVETIVRGLRSVLPGQILDHVKLNGRPTFRSVVPLFLKSLKSQAILSIDRHGKSIFIRFEKDTLHVHLGMTGQLLWRSPDHPMESHTHVVFYFKSSPFELRYRDIRRFGQIRLVTGPIRELNIPDAWNSNDDILFRALRPRTSFLKHALLGQRYLVGLGNIYVDESLFMAGLSPKRSLSRVSDKQLWCLCASIKKVLKKSIDVGGTSFRNYVDMKGGKGGFKSELLVYGKEGRPCPKCKSPILKKVIAGRGTHYCGRCQR